MSVFKKTASLNLILIDDIFLNLELCLLSRVSTDLENLDNQGIEIKLYKSGKIQGTLLRGIHF